MKSQAVQLLEREDYLQSVIEEVKDLDPQTQLEIIAEWLNDVDRSFELGGSYSALMKHAKTVQNYFKKNC
jgi:hypothetical protein